MRLDLFNTSAFRLSVGYTLLVTLAVGVTLGSAYLLTESLITDEVDLIIDTELKSLQEKYARSGVPGERAMRRDGGVTHRFEIRDQRRRFRSNQPPRSIAEGSGPSRSFGNQSATRYGRDDVVEETIELVTAHGATEQRRAVAEFQRRRKDKQLPAALPHADQVAEFVDGEYGRRRYS